MIVGVIVCIFDSHSDCRMNHVRFYSFIVNGRWNIVGVQQLIVIVIIGVIVWFLVVYSDYRWNYVHVW